MRIFLDALHHSWKWGASTDNETEARGCGSRYKASRLGCAELSNTEGAAVIVLAGHDGSSISQTYARSAPLMHWTVCNPPVNNSSAGKKKMQLINGRDWGRLAGIEQVKGPTTSKQTAAHSDRGAAWCWRRASNVCVLFCFSSLNTAVSVSVTKATIRRQKESIFCQFSCLHGRKRWLACFLSRQAMVKKCYKIIFYLFKHP